MTDSWRARAAEILGDPYTASALDVVDARIAAARAVKDTREEPHAIAQYVAEAVFWLCALDESLFDLDPDYSEARSADERGRLLPGMRAARNAAAHSLVAPIARTDRRPFFGKGESYLFFISETPRWRRDPQWDKAPRPDQIESYETYLAGRPVEPTLQAALGWFRDLSSF